MRLKKVAAVLDLERKSSDREERLRNHAGFSSEQVLEQRPPGGGKELRLQGWGSHRRWENRWQRRKTDQ